jgi:hypothetical protein
MSYKFDGVAYDTRALLSRRHRAGLAVGRRPKQPSVRARNVRRGETDEDLTDEAIEVWEDDAPGFDRAKLRAGNA